MENNNLKFNPVSNPSHYQGVQVTIRPIDISKHMLGDSAQAFQYVWRAGKKDGVSWEQDLEKARFFLNDGDPYSSSCGEINIAYCLFELIEKQTKFTIRMMILKKIVWGMPSSAIDLINFCLQGKKKLDESLDDHEVSAQ